jgi:hypothetical protein
MSTLPAILPLNTTARLIGRSDDFARRLVESDVLRAATRQRGIYRSSVEAYLGYVITPDQYCAAVALNEPVRAAVRRFRERQANAPA